jgi:hypothetical protein
LPSPGAEVTLVSNVAEPLAVELAVGIPPFPTAEGGEI